jgi:hypothetical protein
MYGAIVVGAEGEIEMKIGSSNGSLAVRDLVTVETDGQLDATAVGELIEGVVVKAVTGAAASTYYLTGPRLKILMDNDNTGTTFAATHVGARFDAGGTTGAQIVDTSTVDATSTGTGQLKCLKYNPQGYGTEFDSDTSIGLYEVVERQ